MDIYVVSHYYDNGEANDDYRDLEEHFYFSTLKNATTFYWDKVTSDYQGSYILTKKTLDTQEEETIEESEYIECSSPYDWEFDEMEKDPDYDYDYNPYPNPSNSYKEYWEWENLYNDDISSEEDKAWFDYVNTPHSNYYILKKIEEEEQKRKEQILVDELNKTLSELLNDK